MKKTIFVLLASLMIGLPVVAQTTGTDSYQTLFSSSRCTGWYVGFGTTFTKLNDEPVALPDFEAGVIIDNKVSLGITSGGFADVPGELFYPELDGGNGLYLEGGYGGIVVEPILSHKSLVHLSIPLRAGLGGAVYTSPNEVAEIEDDGEIDYHRRVADKDLFCYFEPGVNAEVNVFKFMQITGGASYRFFHSIDLVETPSDAFNGFSARIGLRFGNFNR